MRFAPIALSVLIALPPLATPLWAQTEAAAPAADAASTSLPAITVSTVGTRKLEDHVIASGLIGPVEEVYVPPLIEGQPIESLAADVGDTVTAGQVLATLSSATLTLQKSQMLANIASVKASIAQAEAQLADAKVTAADAQRTADRSAALLKQGSVSSAANDGAQTAATSAASRVAVAAQALESAKAQQELQAAQMANTDLQLARTNIVAPVSGIISARNAQVGAIASAAGLPLFVIIRDGALELKADVAEADIARVLPDQTATLTLASGASATGGKVRLVEPTIDVTSRLGSTRISIDDSDQVRAGMFAEAVILVTARDGLAVPVTAVSSAADGDAVMVIKNGVAERVAIKTGIRDGGWIEVVEGLAAGDTVVTKAGSFVRAGERVNPIAETSTN
jgi:HlyD family secretion protein